MDAAKDEAKSLHRVVAHQAAAKRELTKLRTARTAYLQTWQGYLDQVTETIQQQVEDLLKEGAATRVTLEEVRATLEEQRRLRSAADEEQRLAEEAR